MNDATHVIPVTVQNTVFDSLYSLEKNFQYPSSTILSMLVSEVFDKYSPNASSSHVDAYKSRSLRKKINIPCVLKFMHGFRNITFKSGYIVDISLGGVGIAIRGEGARRGDVVYDSKSFELIAQMENESIPSNFVCRNCYVLKEPQVRVGGALLKPDMTSFRSFLRVFMRASLAQAV